MRPVIGYPTEYSFEVGIGCLADNRLHAPSCARRARTSANVRNLGEGSARRRLTSASCSSVEAMRRGVLVLHVAQNLRRIFLPLLGPMLDPLDHVLEGFCRHVAILPHPPFSTTSPRTPTSHIGPQETGPHRPTPHAYTDAPTVYAWADGTERGKNRAITPFPPHSPSGITPRLQSLLSCLMRSCPSVHSLKGQAINPLRASGELPLHRRAPGKAIEVVALRANDGLVAVQ